MPKISMGRAVAVLAVHGAGGGYDQGLDFAPALVQRGFRVIAMSRSSACPPGRPHRCGFLKRVNPLWLKTITIIIVAFVVCTAVAVIYGSLRWRRDTEKLRTRLEAGRQPIKPAIYDARELEGLPAPVQRYFRTVLKDGQSMVAAVKVAHEGQFSMGETEAKWAPFTSDQAVVTRRPGFDWNPRIRMAPGLYAFVHDAYVAGEGILHATLFGLMTTPPPRQP